MRDFGACWTHRSLVAPFITTVAPSEIFSDAAFRQAYEFGERCIWPARAARQSGDKGGDGRAVVPVEPPQVDIGSGAAGGAARPQEPIAGFDCRTDGRREQHRHPHGLAIVPGGHFPRNQSGVSAVNCGHVGRRGSHYAIRAGSMSSVLGKVLLFAWLACGIGLSSAWTAYLGLKIFRVIGVFF
jgi:hypothetical protein